MSGEIAKLRYLALPRWTAGAMFAIAVVVGAALLVFPPKKVEDYAAIPAFAVGTAFGIAAIVFAVWVASLEFSAGTLQRTLTAEPNRSIVLSSKLICALVGTALVGLGAAATSAGLSEIAASNAGVSLDDGDLAKQVFSQVPSGLAYAGVGFGFGLLTRSMGGGITLALALAFILDGIIGFIPGFENIGFGRLTHDLTSGLSGHGETANGLGAAIIGSIAWVAIVLGPGWVRFVRGDLK
jgi:ABC-2 type transport system permease protein